MEPIENLTRAVEHCKLANKIEVQFNTLTNTCSVTENKLGEYK